MEEGDREYLGHSLRDRSRHYQPSARSLGHSERAIPESFERQYPLHTNDLFREH